MKLKLVALLVLFAGIHMADSRCVYGCDCLGPSMEGALRNAASVFSGTITNIETQKLDGADHVTFKVSRVWKGSKDAELVVTTNTNSTCSFYLFSMNSEYLVYANGKGDTLSVGACSRTALLSDAGGDLKELGKGEPPTPTKSKGD